MNLKKYIKHPRKIFFSIGMRGHFRMLSDEKFVKFMYWSKFGKKLTLEFPVSFNEKIQWLKLNYRNQLYPMLVDKFEVKKYIADKIGDRYIIPTLGIWEKFDDIDFDELPTQFVLKCTHDSGGIVICKDKKEFNVKNARKVINKSLKRNYYWIGREWAYKEVKPRIIAEKYMVDESGVELKDYKVFTFNGVPKVVQVDYDRFAFHRRNLYDTEWNYIPAEILYPTDANVRIKKPDKLDEMLILAKKLSEGHPHVRVDFYVINEEIFFGELTFLHGAGFETFRPNSFGIEMGGYMELPNMSK